MEGIVVLIILGLLLFLFATMFRYRYGIMRWLNDPTMQHFQVCDRKVVLKRRIEDAQNELERIEQSEKGKANSS